MSGMIHFKQKFTLNREKRLRFRLQKKLENWEIWVSKKREREKIFLIFINIIKNELFVIDYINIITVFVIVI